jgi:DNA invertase Pin-like site-specific DNA recombinase
MSINKFIFNNYDNNVYVYIRVSTNKQTTESQLNEIYNYCVKNRIYPTQQNIIIDQGVSGTVEWRNRKINNIINKIKKDDKLIVPEISRLGRSMNEVNEMISICAKKKAIIIDIKNKITLDGTIQSSMMASMCSMFAQMERELISERIKQGLIIAKEKGHLTGRKRGVRKNKLDDKINEITELAKEGQSYKKMGAHFSVDSSQLRKFMINKNINLHYCYKGNGQHKKLISV